MWKQISQDQTKRLEELTDIFEWVGGTLPRLNSYDHLHTEHLPLVHVLTNIYVTVLNVCTQLKTDLARSSRLRGMLTMDRSGVYMAESATDRLQLLRSSRKRYGDQLKTL